MDFNVEVRLKQLDNLDQFIVSSRDKVNSILDYLDWKEEKVRKDDSMIKCSTNSSHRVHVNSIDKHVEKCSLKCEGYDLNEQFLSEPTNDPKSSIMIDDFKKMKLIAESRKKHYDFKTGWNGQDPAPKTVDRSSTTYSSDERAAFYDYSVKHTTGPPELPEFNVYTKPSNDDKPLTYEEKLAQVRDAKRRRIKYRSVHTNRKNHVEVMREVIEGQMELYKEWLLESEKPKIKNDKNDSLVCLDNVKEHDNLSDKSSEHNHSVRSKSSTHSKEPSKHDDCEHLHNNNSKKSDTLKERSYSNGRRERRDYKSRYDEDYYSRDRHKSRHSDSHRSRNKERSRYSRDHSRDRSYHRKRHS